MSGFLEELEDADREAAQAGDVLRAEAGTNTAAVLVVVPGTEPLPSGHALTTLPNVILTPHLGWPTDKKYEDLAEAVADVRLAYLDGREVPRFGDRH